MNIFVLDFPPSSGSHTQCLLMTEHTLSNSKSLDQVHHYGAIDFGNSSLRLHLDIAGEWCHIEGTPMPRYLELKPWVSRGVPL